MIARRLIQARKFVYFAIVAYCVFYVYCRRIVHFSHRRNLLCVCCTRRKCLGMFVYKTTCAHAIPHQYKIFKGAWQVDRSRLMLQAHSNKVQYRSRHLRW